MNFLLTIVFCLGFASKAVPDASPSPLNAPAPDVVLNLGTTLISGNTVKIGYQIPYPGYIEFLLLEKGGKMIWYNAYVKDKGEHFLAFKREKLELGVSYNFTIRYKGKDYPGTFLNN